MNKNKLSYSNLNETRQIEKWRGQLGNDYIERNIFEDWKMEPGKKAFRRIIGKIKFSSILEVGSNIGLNLIYLTGQFGDGVDFYAIEPNKKAFDILISEKRLNLKKAWNRSAFKIPLDDFSVDLVFTAGVLIHIAPDDLGRATDEIVRVARKHVLCIEYFSHKPEEIEYCGKKGLLFKRDFGLFYLERYKNLEWIDYGFLWNKEFG
ncbi:pseudaminic acid biosynthesis-associated methylase, partial [Thermodesulfobacteriota bacterium]